MNLIRKIKNKVKKAQLLFGGATIARTAEIYSSIEVQNPKGFILGEHSVIYKKVTIYNGQHGVFSMKNRSHVAPYGYFLIEKQKLEIGNDVAIGPFCSFFCVSNSTKGKELFRKNYKKGNIVIGNNVFIGSHCVILPNTFIHDDVVVAANSVVSGELQSGYIYSGSPAIPVKEID